MKKTVLILAVLAISLYSCQEENISLQEQAILAEEPLSRSAINDIIISLLKENGSFQWSMVNDHVLWSALRQSDGMLTVGYRPESIQNVAGRIHSLNIHTDEWKEACKSLEKMIFLTESAGNINGAKRKTAIIENSSLPYFDVQIRELVTVEKLRSHPNTRYIEPSGYSIEEEAVRTGAKIEDSIFGCDNRPNKDIPEDDFRTITPGAKVSWTYDLMNIPQAWQYSTGRNTTVAVIDTGVSPNQPKLGSQFATIPSDGRSIFKFSTYPSGSSTDGPSGRCGHGTAMIGTVGAPLSSDGSAVGVAYNANIIGIRGTSDVVISTSREKTGVANAIKLAADNPQVDIISMSIGDVFYNSKIADAIRYADGKGKLIFAAAGTSTAFTNWVGVIFPANMNETIAVTGVTTASRYRRCNNCHSGREVDFTVIMQRARKAGRVALTLADEGNVPSVVGGSSIATATMAGVAAMVWSLDPSMNKNQVLEKLKKASDLYPNKNRSFGWGNVDALKAVQN